MNTCRIIRLTVLSILLLLAGLPLAAQEDAYRADSTEMAKLRALTQYMYRSFERITEQEPRDILTVNTRQPYWQRDNLSLDTLRLIADTIAATVVFQYGTHIFDNQVLPRLWARAPYHLDLDRIKGSGFPKIEVEPAVFTLHNDENVTVDGDEPTGLWFNTEYNISDKGKQLLTKVKTVNTAFPNAPPADMIKSARLSFSLVGQTSWVTRRLTAANVGESFMLNGVKLKLLAFTPDYAVLETLSTPDGKKWGTTTFDAQDRRWKYADRGFYVGSKSLNNQGGSGELFLKLLREEPDINQEDFCKRMEKLILAAAIRGNAGEAPTANDKRKFRIAYPLGEMSSLIVYSDVEEVLVEKTLELDLTQPE